MIRVLINGATGKMGQETVKAVKQDLECELVGAISSADNLITAMQDINPDVVIDFTSPEVVFANTLSIIKANIHPVIGTTGMKEEEIFQLQQIAAEKKLGGIIAPNFSIGALLMMKFASEAARYFPAVEIIELHHENKKDAPSGTAKKTAEMIHQHAGDNSSLQNFQEARGLNYKNIHIHSVRLPGFVAHQEVIFGSIGETLTIRHDSIHRECFMPGVLLACKKVMTLDKLVYGLDQILFS